MEKKSIQFNGVVFATILALGIALSGFFVAQALLDARSTMRFVTVKGLAEKDVAADLGIWQINYKGVGEKLTAVNEELAANQQRVMDFLLKAGFTEDELTVQPLEVHDRFAERYSTLEDKDSKQRYIITSGIRVRSTDVELIKKVSQTMGSLLGEGILLNFNTPINPNPTFYFTGLDEIRAEMLKDATASARALALQFARDSDSQLGKIRRANQGVFQIMGRDFSSESNDWNAAQNALGSIDKRIRLVSTLEYTLD